MKSKFITSFLVCIKDAIELSKVFCQYGAKAFYFVKVKLGVFNFWVPAGKQKGIYPERGMFRFRNGILYSLVPNDPASLNYDSGLSHKIIIHTIRGRVFLAGEEPEYNGTELECCNYLSQISSAYFFISEAC